MTGIAHAEAVGKQTDPPLLINAIEHVRGVLLEAFAAAVVAMKANDDGTFAAVVVGRKMNLVGAGDPVVLQLKRDALAGVGLAPFAGLVGVCVWVAVLV